MGLFINHINLRGICKKEKNFFRFFLFYTLFHCILPYPTCKQRVVTSLQLDLASFLYLNPLPDSICTRLSIFHSSLSNRNPSSFPVLPPKRYSFFPLPIYHFSVLVSTFFLQRFGFFPKSFLLFWSSSGPAVTDLILDSELLEGKI